MAVIQRWLRIGLLSLLLFSLSLGLSAARWNDFDSLTLKSSPATTSIATDTSAINNFASATNTSIQSSLPFDHTPFDHTLISALPPGNAITNGEDLLRYALPIDNKDVRRMQESLENIAERLRAKRWSPIGRDISSARRILQTRRDRMLADVPDFNAELLLDQIGDKLDELEAVLDERQKEQIWLTRRETLNLVGALEEDMVAGFPFEVPEEFSNLPQLKGRATVEMETTQGTLTIVADGYNAPVSAGNFIDLVQRGFYDGLEFTRAVDNFIVQTGDPPGPEQGFVDPDTGEYRSVPLEIMVRGDEEPIYSFTLESIGRYMDEPVLPFSALGTVAIARPIGEPDGGSSQIFFQLYDPEITPAGRNLLDGRYAAFGYVVENEDLLKDIQPGDRITSAKVISGAENLVQPSA